MAIEKTRRLTLASVLVAMSVMLMTVSSYIPVGEGVLFMIGSAMMCAIVCECGVRYALVGFAATAMLTAILAGDKSVPFLFAVLTGWYPVAKLYIERIRKLKTELLLKALTGLFVSALCYIGGRLLGMPFEWYWIVIGTVTTLAYDYVLSLIIQIYYQKIRKHIK